MADTADTAEIDGLDPFALLDIESRRLERFFSQLGDKDWDKPTAAADWRVREVLAHLAGAELYNVACLEDDLATLFSAAAEAGVKDGAQFEDWMIAIRAKRSVGEILGEWRRYNAEVRRRLRGRGQAGTVQTAVGPYPVRLQALHLAMEAALHADDVGAPVEPDEEPGRLEWRARVTRWVLREEHEPSIEVQTVDGANEVRVDGQQARLSDAELVAAASARLPDDHPLPEELRGALRVFS